MYWIAFLQVMKLFLLLTLFGKIYAGCNSKMGAKCITELEMSQTEAWLVPHVKPLGFFQTGDPCFDYAGRHVIFPLTKIDFFNTTINL